MILGKPQNSSEAASPVTSEGILSTECTMHAVLEKDMYLFKLICNKIANFSSSIAFNTIQMLRASLVAGNKTIKVQNVSLSWKSSSRRC